MLFTLLIKGLPLLGCLPNCFKGKYNAVTPLHNTEQQEPGKFPMNVQPLMQDIQRSDRDGSVNPQETSNQVLIDGSFIPTQSRKELEDCVGENDCSICFDVIENVKGSYFCKNQVCKKGFHEKCRSEWALKKENHNCPYCNFLNLSHALVEKEISYVDKILREYKDLPIITDIIPDVILVESADALKDMKIVFKLYKNLSQYLHEMDKDVKFKKLALKIRQLPQFEAISSAKSIISGV